MKKFTLFFLMIMAFTAIKAQLPDNWTDDSGIGVFQEMAEVHSGTYSAGVIVNTAAQGDCDFANEVALPVSEGDDFKVSFWAYTSEQVRITVVLDWVGASSQYTNEYVGPATGDWAQLVYENIVPDGATEVNIRLRFYDVAGFTPPQTQFVDDIEFESPVGEPIVVTNGDFESWPSLAGEPTNYPTDFAAMPIGLSANLTWIDATGDQLPEMYLIYASTSETIDPPVDGEPVIDDLDLSDGMGAVNVAFGTGTFSFTGLMAQTNYYFTIYPYTNTGINIDYKNDGAAPIAMAQTSNVVILNEENFDFGWGDWTTVNVFGDQVWVRDETHGVGGTPCAKVSGYESGDFANEDWLISPAFDFDEYENEVFTFYSALGYPVEVLQLSAKISTDYDGGGDPTTATWTDLAPTLPTGEPYWQWTYSGELDVSGFEGPAVYVAFVYFSDGTDSETWEIDDIMITGEGSFTPLPEPTNYPTDFVASATEQNITTTWVDATGETVPTGYLLKMSDQDNIAAPMDGTPEADDTNFSDGIGTINVAPGEEAYDFENLVQNTMYYFKIYPYTNGSVFIDYKTDGIVPSATATTEENPGEELFFWTFNDSWENWAQNSVVGDQVWDRDNNYGLEDTPCAKMSGYVYEVGSFENEDWLISPGLDLRGYKNEQISFFSAYDYPGLALEFKVSMDYNDGENPNDFTWVNLTGEVNWSAGNFEWAESGDVDISLYADSIVYVAFVFQSTDVESSTWEIDNIKVTGEEVEGIEDVKQQFAQVYPNPSNGNFNIQLKEHFDILEIYSITGQMIYSQEVSGLNISVSLPDAGQGLYFIRLTNQETGISFSKRMIIR